MCSLPFIGGKLRTVVPLFENGGKPPQTPLIYFLFSILLGGDPPHPPLKVKS